MFNFKHCPFCGGHIKFEDRIEWIDAIKTEVRCLGCGMEFTYEQNFTWSADDRCAINISFEEIWERRFDDESN